MKKNKSKTSSKILNALDLSSAIKSIKQDSERNKRNFIESIEIALVINGNLSPSESSSIRGTLQLPKGRGREAKIAFFTKNSDFSNLAISSGAKFSGLDSLIDIVQSKKFNLDFCLATPDTMQNLAKIAKILGPRSLMPNQKDETISSNVEHSTKDFVKNRVRYKSTKNGVIQCLVGSVKQSEEDLIENIKFAKSLICSSGIGQKTFSFSAIYLKSTMGKSYRVSIE